jgi:hypothetical protein
MSSPKAVGLGFVGTGMISDTYLENLTSFADVRVVIVGDLDQQRGRRQAEKYDVPATDSLRRARVSRARHTPGDRRSYRIRPNRGDQQHC